MEKVRLQKIDFLRAVSIVGMIAIHTFSYALKDPLDKFIWNYLHFVVVGFVFCSGYILLLNQNLNSLGKILVWCKKRFIRLLVPFYIYLFCHYFLWILFPQFFSGLGLQKNTRFIMQSIILTGGVGIGWLTVLFLQLTIISPFILKFWDNKKISILYLAFSLIITLSFTIIKFPYDYFRLVMWIPWSLILIFGIYMYKVEIVKKIVGAAKYIKIASVSYIIFFLFLYIFTARGQTTLLIDHKYPPDFFDLSYGLFICSILLIIADLNIFKNKYIEKTYTYVSLNSYQMFFIHFPVLDMVLKISGGLSDPFSISVQFLVVLLVSILISFVSNKIKNIYKISYDV